jgi:hypothetical protein
MHSDTQCNTAENGNGLVGGLGMVPQKSCLSKKRYVELVQLGLTASEELIKHGLQRHEYCEFGRIMERIMQLE